MDVHTEQGIDTNSEETSLAKLNSLMIASQAVLNYRSFNDAARIIFDEARKMTGAKAGYIALLSPSGNENEVLFLEAGGDKCSVDPSLPMPIRGLRAESYLTGESVYNNDFMNSAHVNFMPAGHVYMKNVLFAPLTIEGKVVGIMGLANKPTDFTKDDAQIAKHYGEIASIALNNSQTLDRLNNTIHQLQEALDEVKKLKELIPICANCKNIRDDHGYWHLVEEYMATLGDIKFTHALCPDCIKKLYPDYALVIDDENE